MKIATNRIASELVIKTSRAAMPSSCWGDYARVAVLRVTVGAVPKAIDDRRRNVLEIVETWEKCNVGITARCGYGQALAEARKLAPNAREINTLRGHRL